MGHGFFVDGVGVGFAGVVGAGVGGAGTGVCAPDTTAVAPKTSELVNTVMTLEI